MAYGRENAAEAYDVKGWRDIVQVAAGMYFTTGLKVDGTTVSTGKNSYHPCVLR